MDNKKMRVLIADDEDGLRMSMAGILELEGLEVETAENGYEAIEKAKKGSFDIAFLDIRMPGINGVETFKAIKKISPETVVVMMTAFAVKDLIKEAINEGAYACISKPFDMDKIIDTIQDVSAKPFVMVVDDDPALCNLLYERLKEHGCTVVTRSSGMEGIELVRRKIPDVVFMDIVMDGMDGVETFKELKGMLGDKCPKTIIMSAQDLQNKFDEARRLGAVDCLRKPLNIGALKDTITKMVGQGGGKGKICVVDDDKGLCASLKTALSSNGYDVDVAYSGNEVVDKIKKEAFKIVIIDLRLPDVNALKVYEEIKKQNSDAGVIFIDGAATGDDEIRETVKKNNYIYLHKPFEPENLIKLIETIQETKKDQGK